MSKLVEYSSENQPPNQSNNNDPEQRSKPKLSKASTISDKLRLSRKWLMVRSNSARMASDENVKMGPVVIARPKGGRKALEMNMEEVKACEDLGFELEHYPTLPVVYSGSSTAPGSPIASWQISSPGDDPEDVKARLKVWAQAVAIASSWSGPH